jgi:hypothetical protein
MEDKNYSVVISLEFMEDEILTSCIRTLTYEVQITEKDKKKWIIGSNAIENWDDKYLINIAINKAIIFLLSERMISPNDTIKVIEAFDNAEEDETP